MSSLKVTSQNLLDGSAVRCVAAALAASASISIEVVQAKVATSARIVFPRVATSAGAIFGTVGQFAGAPPPGVDMVKLLVDSGLATAAVSALQVRASIPCELQLLIDSAVCCLGVRAARREKDCRGQRNGHCDRPQFVLAYQPYGARVRAHRQASARDPVGAEICARPPLGSHEERGYHHCVNMYGTSSRQSARDHKLAKMY
jgi:hypothetical protein